MPVELVLAGLAGNGHPESYLDRHSFQVCTVFLGSSSLSRAAYKKEIQCISPGLPDRLFKMVTPPAPSDYKCSASAGCLPDLFLFLSPCWSIAMRGFRVRAARRRGKANL